MVTLVTGGAGYVGSHIVHELIDAGETVVVIDNLSTGSRAALPATVPLMIGDCGDPALVSALIERHRVSAIVHVAGSTPGPLDDPLGHYRNNTINTRNLVQAAVKCGVRHFVFCSTAAVYGNSDGGALSEDAPTGPVSAYGQSKLISEIMLQDFAVSHGLHYAILRVFDVAGADPRRRHGLANGHPASLVKRAVEAALATDRTLDIHGIDFPTPDGTFVRDYIHVSDVARAHHAALEYLRAGGADAILNCGCGRGYSVLDVINAVERVSGRRLPVGHLAARPGDTARAVADTGKIRSALTWHPRFDALEKLVTHAMACEIRRPERRDAATSPFLRLVAETGVPAAKLQTLLSGFGSPSRPRAAAPPSELAVVADTLAESQPALEARKLTIGMATYDDYDGVYFTLQAIRLYHPEILDDVEFIVVDNNPDGPCAQALKDLAAWIPNYRHIPKGDISGTAVRDWIFREARGDFVLCIDCHVLIEAGALKRLIDFFVADPATCDLLHGPLVYDDLTNCSTHFEPEWRAGMYGSWGCNPAGAAAHLSPFEIPMQGLGLFACRRSAWPGFNPHFRGFGGEEGYIHEKFRQRGGKVLCLPFLRWIHRFGRPLGTHYANRWEDRVRNYLIGFRELGWDTLPVVDHFKALLGEQAWSEVVGRLDPEWLRPLTVHPLQDGGIGAQGITVAAHAGARLQARGAAPA